MTTTQDATAAAMADTHTSPPAPRTPPLHAAGADTAAPPTEDSLADLAHRMFHPPRPATYGD